MIPIISVDAWEILDSRGHPTLRVLVETASASGTFSVPAGASTGQFEAHERRDGTDRYGGLGVAEAIHNVQSILAPLVVGRDVTAQQQLDATMVEHDGTEHLSSIGANAILGVSGAVAHAASNALDIPLYSSLATDTPGHMPLPMVNLLSGGLHARGGLALQDILVIPRTADSYRDALEIVWDIRTALESIIIDSGERPLVADEGGFAPNVAGIDEAFKLVERAIKRAGYVPDRTEIALAVDIAATHFYHAETERYRIEGESLTSTEMIETVAEWVSRYPILSIEDPLVDTDWAGWTALGKRIDDDIQILGDDLLVTNVDRCRHAHETGAANAVLVKPNQAGTISRAIDVIHEAQQSGMNTVVSARSGETCDSTIADLAVGLDAGQIKIGSLARSERLAKYNRLLEIGRTQNAALADPF